MGRQRRYGIRTRGLIAMVTLSVAIVVASAAVHLDRLSRFLLGESVRQCEIVAQQIYAGAREVIASSVGAEVSRTLRKSDVVRSLVRAAPGHSPYVVAAAIVSREGEILVHSDPAREGGSAPRHPKLRGVHLEDPIRRLRAVYGGDFFEVDLPVELDGKPFGSIRLAVAAALLRVELNEALRTDAWMGVVALAAAVALAFLITTVTVRSVRLVQNQVDRFRQGRFEVPSDEWWDSDFGPLLSHLRLLGDEIRSERAKLVARMSSLEQLVDHLRDGVLILNGDERILFFNRAFAPILGDTKLEDAVGKPLSDLLDGDHPVVALLEEASRDGAASDRVRLPGDESLPIGECVASVFRLESSETGSSGTVLILENLESLRMLRSIAEYGVRMKSLADETATVVHEVKNPLQAINLQIALLRNNLPNRSDAVDHSLEVMGRQLRLLDRVVQDFLQFIRQVQSETGPVDLGLVLRETVELYEREAAPRGIRLELESDPGSFIVDGDETHLRQVFSNLVKNALEALPDEGTVRVRLGAEGSAAIVVVEDTGVGIDAEALKHIFQLYYTTKSDGSGIGLPVVRKIVESHKGTVDVESEPGRGTRVTVRLPCQQWEPAGARSLVE